MRIILPVALIGFFLSSSVLASTVLVVGDSISAAYGLNEQDGWVQLAENALSEHGDEPIEFINASISGDTTEGALRRLPAALERFKPDVLIIELGGNDGLRGYSMKKMRENLVRLATMGQDAGAEVLLLGMQIPSNYGPAYTERFAKAFVDAADQAEVELLPFLLEPIATDQDYFQPDGVHPTAKAQPLMAEHVLSKLKPMLFEVVKP